MSSDSPQTNPCPHCVDYVGKCPYCHSTRPAIRQKTNPRIIHTVPSFAPHNPAEWRRRPDLDTVGNAASIAWEIFDARS